MRRRGSLATAYRLLRTIEHRVQMVDDAQTHLLPAEPAALDNVARLHGLAERRRAARRASARTSSARARSSTASPRTSARQLSNDPEILRSELDALGFADAEGGCTARRRLALGQGAVAALAGRAAGVRGDASRRCCGRSPRAPIRTARSTGSATSSSGCRAGSISSGCSRRGRRLPQLLAKILAHAPALADQLARRPELLEGLFDASSFAMPPTRRGVRRSSSPTRCAASPTTSRSTASGGSSTSGGSRSASS